MTVRELIVKLQDMPPETQVVAREMDGGFFTVGPEDLAVDTLAFYPVGSGKYGYWERSWDGRKGQMVVVIAP